MIDFKVPKTVVFASFLGLAACSGDVNPTRDVLVGIGVGAQTTPPPDFVVQSRPAGERQYIPVGTSAPPRAAQARNAAEVQAAEAEMDAIRAANEAAAAAAAAQAAGVAQP